MLRTVLHCIKSRKWPPARIGAELEAIPKATGPHRPTDKKFPRAENSKAGRAATGIKPTMRQLGAQWEAAPKAKGTRGQIQGKPKGSGSSGGSILVLPDGAAPTLESIGLDRKEAALAKMAASADRRGT